MPLSSLLWLAAGAGSCQACCLQAAAGVELTRHMSTATLLLQHNPPAGQFLLLLLCPPPLLLLLLLLLPPGAGHPQTQ